MVNKMGSSLEESCTFCATNLLHSWILSIASSTNPKQAKREYTKTHHPREGKLVDGKDNLTGAILLNPKSSLLLASRASVFVKLKKPNAAICDADATLKMNSSLAKGYKARGMANAMLGLWEQADKDLSMASKLDFDEETVMMLKKVSLNAKKVKDHREKYENLRKERELRRVAEAVSVLREGEVIGVQSASILKNKLDAASKDIASGDCLFHCNMVRPLSLRISRVHKHCKEIPKSRVSES